MRSSRVAAAVVVLLVAASAPVAPAAAQALPLPKRTVTATVVKVEGRLIMKGQVSPGHANRAVFIQRKTCKSCDWGLYRKVMTGDASRYRVRILAPKKGAWFWRAKVRAYGGYATSYSQVWKTFLA